LLGQLCERCRRLIGQVCGVHHDGVGPLQGREKRDVIELHRSWLTRNIAGGDRAAGLPDVI